MGIANNQFNWGRRFWCLSSLLLCHFPFLAVQHLTHTSLYEIRIRYKCYIVAGITVILLCGVLIMVVFKF